MIRWCLVALLLLAGSLQAQLRDQRFAHTIYLQPYSKVRQAAELGDVEAQYDLAYLYYKAGEDPAIQGVAQNYRRAAYWYEKAALQGHARAQYNMGVLHLHGHGVERDPIEAYAWLLRSAETGHHESELLLAELDRILNDKQLVAARSRAGELGVPSAPP